MRLRSNNQDSGWVWAMLFNLLVVEGVAAMMEQDVIWTVTQHSSQTTQYGFHLFSLTTQQYDSNLAVTSQHWSTVVINN